MASAKRIVDELKKCGVTHLVGLPDNASAALFGERAGTAGIERIAVTREGEAFALAAGLWMGGRTPAVIIQNTGLLESGDAYRGTALRMRVPLLCLITFRGHAGLVRAPRTTVERPTIDDLARPDLDSTALLTEPTLRAWALPFEYLHEDEDAGRIAAAFERALAESRPVAVLVTGTVT